MYFSRVIEENISALDKIQKFHNSSNKAVLIESLFVLNYFNLINYPNGRLSFPKERLFIASYSMFFRKKSILKNVFNQEMLEIAESGLKNYWISKYTDERKVRMHMRTSSQLHIENIIGAVQISAIMCVICFIVFVLEMISVRYQRVRSLLDYLTY